MGTLLSECAPPFSPFHGRDADLAWSLPQLADHNGGGPVRASRMFDTGEVVEESLCVALSDGDLQGSPIPL